MLRTLTAAAVLSALLAAPSPVRAQHDEHAGAPPGEKLGTVSFENSCSAALRADFNRAVALLHSFEFRAAIDALDAVLARDEACAIAHWGVALSYWGNPFAGGRSAGALQQGHAAIGKARAAGKPTARERAYIDAVAKLFENHEKVPQRERVLAYERAMADVVEQNPLDVEATIFHALAVNQTAAPNDKTYAAQLRAAGILEPLYKVYPDHPGLAHYIIHAYDHPPLAARALDAARRYAGIAPSAPHALHMPSHTFTRVGLLAGIRGHEPPLRAVRGAQRRGDRSVARDGLSDLRVFADGTGQRGSRRARPCAGGRREVRCGGHRGRRRSADGGLLRARRNPGSLCARARRVAGSRRAASTGQRHAVHDRDRAFRSRARRGAQRPAAAASADVTRLAALRDQLEGQDDYWAEQVDIQWRTATAWIGVRRRAKRARHRGDARGRRHRRCLRQGRGDAGAARTGARVAR